jgi:methylase of polypeptide subunit release factors
METRHMAVLLEALDSFPNALTLPSDTVSSARVLELGSGAGLLGLLVATIQQLNRPTDTEQASCIYLTDIDDDVLARCALNIRLPCS